MRKVLLALGILALTSCLLALTPPPSRVDASTARPQGLAAYTKIKHVVIIYQENHTFDDVLGTVCQTRTTPCDGYVGPVTFADGKTAANVTQPDIIPAVAHDPDSQDLGMNDKWNKIRGCAKPPYLCVSHVDPSNIPNLTALADTFVVSDATFAAGHSASFGAHVTLAAGTLDGFAGYNPEPPGIGWGCPSQADALWGTKKHLTMEPSCIPDQKGRGPYRKSRVPYAPTVMERLESSGRTWHIYEGQASGDEPPISAFSVCTYFYWCYGQRWTTEWDSGNPDFLASAADGTLPTLSILIPDGHTSQHNLTSMAEGDNYVGEIVSAVANGPLWRSTAIFVTYDDCGCFYDHVVPPSKSLGLRNPMVIISPWARPQWTDSTVAVQPYSMLSFIQHNFGLSPLTANVDKAYDYANAFDFSQQPLRSPPMTTQPISPKEQLRLSKLLLRWEDDPT